MTDRSTTQMIESYLKQINAGDETAIDQLIGCADKRLSALCERIVGRMVKTKQYIRVSDVHQESFFRLKNALVKPNVNPQTVGEFMGLAARHIRFQVLDMLREAKKHLLDEGTSVINGIPDTTPQDNIEMWTCFYEAFEDLPEEEQQVADLLWTWMDGEAVQNLTQYQAAEVLGISRDRVKDLWRNAKIKIAAQCRDFSPFNA